MKQKRLLIDFSTPKAVTLIFFAIVFLCIVGCTAVRYTEPATGSKARVRFVINIFAAGEYAYVYGYKTENCESEESWMRLSNGPVIMKSPRKRLEIPLWNFQDNAAKEFYISTERPLIVQFKSLVLVDSFPVSWYICDVPIIYQLEEKDYEISFHWPWHDSGCSAEVFEIVETNFGLHNRRLLKTFDNKMSVDNADCMRAFEKRRRHWSDIMFHDLRYK